MSEDRVNRSVPTDSVPATDSRRSDGEPIDDLQDEIRRLRQKNRRLREKYEETQQTRTLQTVLGLAAVGLLAGVTAIVVPSTQEVLFTIAATGLFAAVLTYTLTSDRFVPVEVGEGIYESLSYNEQAIANSLGLSEVRVYVPTDFGPRLFVPEIDAYNRSVTELRGDTDTVHQLREPFVVSELASESGLSLRPTASTLLSTFSEQRGNSLPSEPTEAVVVLAEGATDVLELAREVQTDVDARSGRATFEVQGQLFGPLTRFDHPVTSFFGAGLTKALSKPVEVSLSETDDGPFVICQWPTVADERNDIDQSL
ncbi:hypothetical protein [Salinigranum halophilum]|uniref:hypothetical protein n=1 Tax=Salinigranum halophilum TaxID=2565931 RepID=UPI0010A89F2C|nr:hypothetical protein [Salinigranum halophilum]